MKLKKLSGFNSGLTAPAVGNAYTEQFIRHDECKHAVAIRGGKIKDIDNALVTMTDNGSYGYPLQEGIAS